MSPDQAQRVMRGMQQNIAAHSNALVYGVAIALVVTLTVVVGALSARRGRVAHGSGAATGVAVGALVSALSVLLPWGTLTSPPIYGQTYHFSANLFQIYPRLDFQVGGFTQGQNHLFAWGLLAVEALAVLALVLARGSVGFWASLVGGLVVIAVGVVSMLTIQWSEFARDALSPGHLGLGAFTLLGGGLVMTICSLWRLGATGRTARVTVSAQPLMA